MQKYEVAFEDPTTTYTTESGWVDGGRKEEKNPEVRDNHNNTYEEIGKQRKLTLLEEVIVPKYLSYKYSLFRLKSLLM